MSSLVGGFNPSEKKKLSVGMIIPNIWENNPNVPNHQPVIQCEAPKVAKLVYNSNNCGLWYL